MLFVRYVRTSLTAIATFCQFFSPVQYSSIVVQIIDCCEMMPEDATLGQAQAAAYIFACEVATAFRAV